MSKIVTIILIIIGFLIVKNVFKEDKWRGFYYPNGSFAPVIYSPEYSSEEDCINWAENERNLRPEDAGLEPQNLYECGKNCKLSNPKDPVDSIYICEQTFDGGDWRRGDYGK